MSVLTRVLAGREVLHLLLAQKELVVSFLSPLALTRNSRWFAVLPMRYYPELDEQVHERARGDKALADNFERRIDDLRLAKAFERLLRVPKLGGFGKRRDGIREVPGLGFGKRGGVGLLDARKLSSLQVYLAGKKSLSDVGVQTHSGDSWKEPVPRHGDVQYRIQQRRRLQEKGGLLWNANLSV